MWSDDVAGVDSFHQSLLQLLNVLDEFVLLWLEVKVLRAGWQFESIEVAEMWLEWSVHAGVVNLLDGAKSVRKTVEFVMSQELLMEVQVFRSVAIDVLLFLSYLLQVFSNDLLLVLLLCQGLLLLLLLL